MASRKERRKYRRITLPGSILAWRTGQAAPTGDAHWAHVAIRSVDVHGQALGFALVPGATTANTLRAGSARLENAPRRDCSGETRH